MAIMSIRMMMMTLMRTVTITKSHDLFLDVELISNIMIKM